ncbi:putative cytochrome P450 301a1, mitochondrial [Nymphon striatum]|nr:putative cytochrome P450 301a1, mitochondrial [Nymphon striatum]
MCSLGKYSLNKLHEANYDKYFKYGNIFKEEFKKGVPLLQLYNPEDFLTVIRNQGKCPVRPPHEATYHYRRSNPEDYKSVGLVNAQGEEWQNLRNAVSPFMLDLNVMKGYLPQQNEVCEDFIAFTCAKYIKEAMHRTKNRPHNTERMRTVLESLVSLSSKEINSKDVTMTLIDFMVAGIDTVSNSLTYVFNELAKHQSVQQKLWEEINRILPNRKEFTSADLNNLPYLNATMKEVFRISPTIPGVVRVTQKEHFLCGYEIPKNTVVFCHSMVASKLKENFNDPDAFMPERWLRDTNRHKTKAYSVLPFGFGARMCIGRRFAEQEMKTTIVKVMQNFRIEFANKSDPPIGQVYRFLVVPDKELNIKLVNRN